MSGRSHGIAADVSVESIYKRGSTCKEGPEVLLLVELVQHEHVLEGVFERKVERLGWEVAQLGGGSRSATARRCLFREHSTRQRFTR